MRTRLRACSALVISSMLVVGVTAAVSAEGVMEACYQKQVGNLRKATEKVPCNDNSENPVQIQIGAPAPPTGGGGLGGYEIVDQPYSVAKIVGGQEPNMVMYDITCPAGKVVLSAGLRQQVLEQTYPNLGETYSYVQVIPESDWPVSADTWRFVVSLPQQGSNGPDPVNFTLRAVCVDA